MEGKKSSKRTKTNDFEDLKQPCNVDSEADLSNMCSSSDFPSSQECFSIGWDWSGQKSDKPSIRVVERPVQRKNETVELLQCQRKRQFVRKCDPDLFDASLFVDQLKSLAAGFKCVPESTSPVASPPPSVMFATPARTSSERFQEAEESLKDLLDDSLGADLFQCTQDYEQKQLQTPTLQEVGLSSSKRKHRLSLSSSKNSKTVCRRINDIYEKQAGAYQKTSEVPREQNLDKKNNNKNDSAEVVLNEAASLTIGQLEKRPQPIMQGCDHTVEITNANAEKTLDSDLEDDEFASPDLLSMIDALEKNETQEKLAVPDSSNSTSSSDPAACTKVPVTVKQHEESINKLTIGVSRHQTPKTGIQRKQVLSVSSKPLKDLSSSDKTTSTLLNVIDKKNGESMKKLRAEVSKHPPLYKELQEEQVSSGQSNSPATTSSDSASVTILDSVNEVHENGLKNMRAEANRPTKKSLSLGGGPLRCTP
ncbi:hypothetical protein KUF71_015268 [Frankliniella fusca]|uniref:Uncharacterized protein n=1 Tax=Frankliniella fusca TaxID=407009 RepID=A0AAE1LQR7_9NEOP|nr:hypothetical protein KUF71_015268 [Frankliniella fusca]